MLITFGSKCCVLRSCGFLYGASGLKVFLEIQKVDIMLILPDAGRSFAGMLKHMRSKVGGKFAVCPPNLLVCVNRNRILAAFQFAQDVAYRGLLTDYVAEAITDCGLSHPIGMVSGFYSMQRLRRNVINENNSDIYDWTCWNDALGVCFRRRNPACEA